MKPIQSLLITVILASLSTCALAQQSNYFNQPVNSLRPEKSIYPSHFAEKEFKDLSLLIRATASTFETEPSKKIAVLFNNQYFGVIEASGNFREESESKLMSTYPIVNVEYISVVYNPNFMVEEVNYFFVGYINVNIPLPTPEAVDSVKDQSYALLLGRLFQLRKSEADKQERVPVSTRNRANIMAGILLETDDRFLGFGAEVPISKKTSLGSDLVFLFSNGTYETFNQFGFTDVSGYNYYAIEGRLFAKYYIGKYYPTVYFLGGGYLRYAKAVFFDYNTLYNDRYFSGSSGGCIAGLGYQFKNGFFVNGMVNLEIAKEKILLRNRVSYIQIAFGYRFGDP